MFVSGFTIVRNALKYDYPVVESICSILPFCDEVIVLVGKSEDDTLALIESIGSDKIKIHHSIWDDTLREGGRILAIETDKARKLVSPEADWCFYIQADELVNEEHTKEIVSAMQEHVSNKQVDGLLFEYKHFFGNFNFVANSRTYYRNEIRIVRNIPEIQSYRDAQGFRKNGQKLKVKKSGGQIFHYGWVRHPEVMKEKIRNFHQLWHSDEWIKAQEKLINEFDYSTIDDISPFTGKHPSCIQARISLKNWDFKPKLNKKNSSLKNRLLYWFENKTGYRLGEFKNYELI
ncbi:MAG: glycosyl transferase [Bacteroidetes bacterium B1(2017)]|nr:MAG: glycosyl transferase [Bacteroidetes bacterium B1(2017)]